MIAALHPLTPSTTTETRALIVGLALIPLTLVIIASVPALIIMPFTHNGMRRVETFVGWMTAWSVSILTYSREGAHQ
jgi:hypothetical protein